MKLSKEKQNIVFNCHKNYVILSIYVLKKKEYYFKILDFQGLSTHLTLLTLN